jgi:hypothetical protein
MDCEASGLQFGESSPIRDIVHIDKPPLLCFVCVLMHYLKYNDQLFVV